MSEENVAIIRRWWEEIERTGEQDLSVFAPDLEVHDHDLPDADVKHGIDGYLAWMEGWGEVWQSYEMKLEEFIDAGDKVVAVFQMTATGSASGITLNRQDASVNTLRDGKIVRIDYFNNKADALAAARVEAT